MKRHLFLPFILLFIFSVSSLPGKPVVDSTPLITLPAVHERVTERGLRIIHIHDELPQVVFAASVGYGRLYEKGKSAGAGMLLEKFITLAGSKKYPGRKLHQALQDIGARLSVSTGWEQCIVSIQVLQRHHEKALDIFADILQHPNFDEKYLPMARAMVIEELRRRDDDPAQVALEHVRHLIFNGTSYGAMPTPAKVRAMNTAMLQKLWQDHVTGVNTVIGVTSPLEGKVIAAKISSTFASIQKGKTREYQSDNAAARKNVALKKDTIYFYRKNIPQATIVAATVAPTGKSEDRFALTVMNYILGGGSFNSRLMKDIRVQRGLAYTVQSIYRGRKNAGLFLVFTQTKTGKVPLVLDIIDSHLKKISREKVTEKEINWIREYIKNSYIFRFNTPLSLLTSLIDLHYYGLPRSYLKSYPRKIGTVTRDDIVEKTAKLLEPGYIRVVVGSEKLYRELKKTKNVELLR